jgi:hypothetical protein
VKAVIWDEVLENMGLLMVGVAATWDPALIPHELQRADAYDWFLVFGIDYKNFSFL